MTLIEEYLKLIDEERKMRCLEESDKERVKIRKRLQNLERKAKQKDDNLYCQLMLYKLCAGMDELSVEEKERCISFGAAVSAIEDVAVSEETKNEIQSWIDGEKTFLSVFENTLSRYGFPTEIINQK